MEKAVSGVEALAVTGVALIAGAALMLAELALVITVKDRFFKLTGDSKTRLFELCEGGWKIEMPAQRGL